MSCSAVQTRLQIHLLHAQLEAHAAECVSSRLISVGVHVPDAMFSQSNATVHDHRHLGLTCCARQIERHTQPERLPVKRSEMQRGTLGDHAHDQRSISFTRSAACLNLMVSPGNFRVIALSRDYVPRLAEAKPCPP